MLTLLCASAVLFSPSHDFSCSGSSFIGFKNPDIHIKMSSGHVFLGTYAFEIPEIADGTRSHFVRVKGGRMVSMWIIQRERIKSNSDEEFRYSFENAVALSGHRFKTNVFAFSNQEARKENPNGEAARTWDFLKTKKVESSDEWIMARWVTVPDIEKKYELIISYAVPSESYHVKISELYGNNDELPLMKEISQKVLEESKLHFAIRH